MIAVVKEIAGELGKLGVTARSAMRLLVAVEEPPASKSSLLCKQPFQYNRLRRFTLISACQQLDSEATSSAGLFSPIPQSNTMSSDPKHDELHKQLFEEGLKMRRSVVGDEYVNRALENGSTDFSRAGQELVTEFCWGYAWTRPVSYFPTWSIRKSLIDMLGVNQTAA